jgi:hypothetical protein
MPYSINPCNCVRSGTGRSRSTENSIQTNPIKRTIEL